MADHVSAVVAALSEQGPYVTVSGRSWEGAQRLVDGAAEHVVVPATRARLAVCEGLRLGGHQAVAVLDAVPEESPSTAVVAVTAVPECVRGALAAGWFAGLPSHPDDVAALLRHTDLLLLGPDGAEERDPTSAALTHLRVWQEGAMATLVASGAMVATLTRLARRLAARGVEVAAIELAVLNRPVHQRLADGTAIGVGGPDAAAALQHQVWDDDISFVDTADLDDAGLVGAVLARVPAPSAR